MLRFLTLFALLLGLTACSNATKDLARPVEPVGNFTLGHSIVIAPNLQKLLVSRDATADEWITTMDQAIEKRFRRFEGGKYYHFGISIEAYSLPPPIIPGKSALALRLTVWDDAAQTKLNKETHVIQVIQVFESRLNLTRDEQMTKLADEAALQIEDWMREQMVNEGWFVGTEMPLDTTLEAPSTISSEDAAAAVQNSEAAMAEIERSATQ